MPVDIAATETLRNQVLLCIVGVAATCSISMLNPFLTPYAHQSLGATVAEAGLTVSVFYIASLLSKVPIGLFASLSRTPFYYTASLVGMSFAPLLYALVPVFPVFLAARALNGLTLSVFSIFSFSITSTLNPRGKRAGAIGAYTASTGLGFMVGPGISAFTLPILGPESTFFLSSFSALLALVTSSILLRESRASFRGRERVGGFSSFREALRNRELADSFLTMFTIWFLYAVILAYVPIYAIQGLGASQQQVSVLFFGYFLLALLSRLVFSNLMERLGSKRLFGIAMVNALVMGLTLSLTRSFPLFTAALILLGLSHGLFLPWSAFAVANAVGPGELILSNAVLLSATDSGGILGPALTAWVAEVISVPSAIFASTMMLFLPLIFVGRIKVSGKPTEDHSA